jgi:hypothetical protein
MIFPMKQTVRPIECIKIKPSLVSNLFDIEFRETPTNDALDSLLSLSNNTYRLAPSITGTVYLKIGRANIDDIITLICRANSPRLLIRKSENVLVIERDTISSSHPGLNNLLDESILVKSPIPTLPMRLKIIIERPKDNQSVEEQRVSMTVQNTPTRDVLANFFEVFNIDFILSTRIQGLSNISFKNEPFDTALRKLLHTGSVPMTYTKEGKLYLIRPRAILQRK